MGSDGSITGHIRWGAECLGEVWDGDAMDEAFYKELDEHFDSFEPGKYSYSVIWGNGLEAPKGESDDDDINFSIHIEKDSKTFSVVKT